jgi:hypothetical protein
MNALDNPNSRTFLLYFVFFLVACVIYGIFQDAHFALYIALGLFSVVIVGLLVMSFVIRREDTDAFSKSLRVHIIAIWFCSFFISPFVGAVNINALSEPIKGVPFNLFGAICFGYFIVMLIVLVVRYLVFADRGRKQ